MKRKNYEILNKKIHSHGFERILRVINNSVTLAIFVFYPSLLVFLFLAGYEDFLKMVLVPLTAFIAVTAARYFINAKRPYEIMDITPVTNRVKSGKSFPSRHVFSIIMIALCCFNINTVLGIILLILSVVLAVLRVVCGAHFIKDVLAGAAIAAVAFIIGFIIL